MFIKQNFTSVCTAALLFLGTISPVISYSPRYDNISLEKITSKSLDIHSKTIDNKNPKSITIAIDPGHDNINLGCHIADAKEEILTLDASKKLDSLLTREGLNVFLTRYDSIGLNIKRADLNGDIRLLKLMNY